MGFVFSRLAEFSCKFKDPSTYNNTQEQLPSNKRMYMWAFVSIYRGIQSCQEHKLISFPLLLFLIITAPDLGKAIKSQQFYSSAFQTIFTGRWWQQSCAVDPAKQNPILKNNLHFIWKLAFKRAWYSLWPAMVCGKCCDFAVCSSCQCLFQLSAIPCSE